VGVNLRGNMIWLSVVSAPWSELDRTKGGLESLISGTVQMLHANAKSEHSNKAGTIMLFISL